MKKSSPLGRFQDHAEWGCIPQQPASTCVNISRKSNKLVLKFLHSQPADHRKRSRKPYQLTRRKQHSTRKAKGVSNWLMQLTFTFWVSLSLFHGHYFHLTVLYVFSLIARRSTQLMMVACQIRCRTSFLVMRGERHSSCFLAAEWTEHCESILIVPTRFTWQI